MEMMTVKTALIVAAIFLIISPAIGQPGSALGLTPGSVAYTSGDIGLFGDFAAGAAGESVMLIPDHLGLAPRPDIFACWRLGMSMECKTPEQQMELASNEMTLLNKLGYSPFEVPASEPVNIPPKKVSAIETIPSFYSEENNEAIESAAKIIPETPSEVEKLFSGGGSEIPVSPSDGAKIPASGEEPPQKIVVLEPATPKCKPVSPTIEPCRIARLGLVNEYHNMEILLHGGIS
jgi:hypothetical protein